MDRLAAERLLDHCAGRRQKTRRRQAWRAVHFLLHEAEPKHAERNPTYQWWFVTDKATGIVSIGHKQAQTLDVFRSIIEAGVTECDQIAAEMKVQKYTVSRLAKKAMDAGWLKKKGRNYQLIETEKEGEK